VLSAWYDWSYWSIFGSIAIALGAVNRKRSGEVNRKLDVGATSVSVGVRVINTVGRVNAVYAMQNVRCGGFYHVTGHGAFHATGLQFCIVDLDSTASLSDL
jgi:hypothetical protein